MAEKMTLATCPFCGFEPEVFPKDPKIEGDAWTKVQCTHKGCGLAAAVAYRDRGHRRAAFKLWNKRANLAQPAQAVDVDSLAQEIRRVDGNHSLGAGALAEALIPFVTRAIGNAQAEE